MHTTDALDEIIRDPLAHWRFWHSVSVPTQTSDACWLWTGKVWNNGYGAFSFRDRRFLAHRIAYRLIFGPIEPADSLICHHCDVRLCVNPWHLFAGTARQNTLDMIAKGRQGKKKCRGEEVHTAKITAAMALEIYQSKEPAKVFFEKFGVSKCTVSSIRTGKSWRHVTNHFPGVPGSGKVRGVYALVVSGLAHQPQQDQNLSQDPQEEPGNPAL